MNPVRSPCAEGIRTASRSGSDLRIIAANVTMTTRYNPRRGRARRVQNLLGKRSELPVAPSFIEERYRKPHPRRRENPMYAHDYSTSCPHREHLAAINRQLTFARQNIDPRVRKVGAPVGPACRLARVVSGTQILMCAADDRALLVVVNSQRALATLLDRLVGRTGEYRNRRIPHAPPTKGCENSCSDSPSARARPRQYSSANPLHCPGNASERPLANPEQSLRTVSVSDRLHRPLHCPVRYVHQSRRLRSKRSAPVEAETTITPGGMSNARSIRRRAAISIWISEGNPVLVIMSKVVMARKTRESALSLPRERGRTTRTHQSGARYYPAKLKTPYKLERREDRLLPGIRPDRTNNEHFLP